MAAQTYSLTNPGSELLGTGTIHVILVMNMKRWISGDSLDKFFRLRDSEEYAQCLRELPKHIDKSKFKVDARTEELEQIGYELGVFRAYVRENLFMPTFALMDKTPPMPTLQDSSPEGLDYFRECWTQWPIKKVRLSRGGTIAIKLECPIRDTPLVSLAETVLGLEHFEPRVLAQLQAALSEGNGEKVDTLTGRLRRVIHRKWGIQWEIANQVVHQFFQSIAYPTETLKVAHSHVLENHSRLRGANLSVEPNAVAWINHNNPEKTFFLNMTAPPLGTETHPLRDRYVVFAFSKLTEAANPDIPLSPDQIQTNEHHCKSIASLLEGVIVGRRSEHPQFAEYKERVAREIVQGNDLATWQNELCLLTLDNGLVYHYTDHQFPTSQVISFLDREVKHEDYWNSIIRGIEHLMDIRVQAQMMAGETADRLVRAAEYARRYSGSQTAWRMEERHSNLDQDIRRFAVDVSYLARIVAHLRNSCSHTTLAKADYAADKFQVWLETSNVAKSLQDADSNLHDINAFLSHYDDTRLGQESIKLSKSIEELQMDAQSTNDWTLVMTAMFSGIMTVLSFLSLPSFMADLDRIPLVRPYSGFISLIGVLTLAISFSITAILIAVAIVRIPARRRRRGRSLLGPRKQ